MDVRIIIIIHLALAILHGITAKRTKLGVPR